MDLRDALRATLAGRTLDRDQTREVLAAALSEGTDPVLLGGVLVALAARGETAEQIAGGAEALRHALSANAFSTTLMRKQSLSSFAISTIAARVLACFPRFQSSPCTTKRGCRARRFGR